MPWVDRREHFGEVRTAQMDLDWDARATFELSIEKHTGVLKRKGLYTQPGIRHLGHLSLQGVLALLRRIREQYGLEDSK